MLRNFHSLYVGCLVLILASCEKTQKIKASYCSSTPNITMHVSLSSDPEAPELFKALVEICNQYGNTQIVKDESLYNKNEMRVFMDFAVTPLCEGLVPNFGKRLPVNKVAFGTLDYCAGKGRPVSRDVDVYIGLGSDSSENTQKTIAAFKNLMSRFNEYYKIDHPNASSPIFYIEEPYELELIKRGDL